jgi:hypothetical protein
MSETVHIFRLRMTPEIELAVEQVLLNRRKESGRIGKNEVLLDLLSAALRDDGMLAKKRERKTKPELKLRRVIK